jgi:hypothetical protein
MAPRNTGPELPCGYEPGTNFRTSGLRPGSTQLHQSVEPGPQSQSLSQSHPFAGVLAPTFCPCRRWSRESRTAANAHRGHNGTRGGPWVSTDSGTSLISNQGTPRPMTTSIPHRTTATRSWHRSVICCSVWQHRTTVVDDGPAPTLQASCSAGCLLTAAIFGVPRIPELSPFIRQRPTTCIPCPVVSASRGVRVLLHEAP